MEVEVEVEVVVEVMEVEVEVTEVKVEVLEVRVGVMIEVDKGEVDLTGEEGVEVGVEEEGQAMKEEVVAEVMPRVEVSSVVEGEVVEVSNATVVRVKIFLSERNTNDIGEEAVEDEEDMEGAEADTNTVEADISTVDADVLPCLPANYVNL